MMIKKKFAINEVSLISLPSILSISSLSSAKLNQCQCSQLFDSGELVYCQAKGDITENEGNGVDDLRFCLSESASDQFYTEYE
ncbi:MAG: hypothetical protein EZS28_034431, partial [Streblomastix strix]